MSIRTCMVLSAFASLLAANSALAQNAAPKPAAAPRPAPAPAVPPAAPNAPAAAPAAPAAPPANPPTTQPTTQPAEPGAEAPANAGVDAGGEDVAGADASAAPEAPVAPGPAPNRQVLPAFPEPGSDARTLTRMGNERPDAAKKKAETDVFAEDWWSHVRPVVELHGNFRVRSELFYRFSLGRVDPPGAFNNLWPRPPDSPYRSDPANNNEDRLCTADEAGSGSSNDLANPVPCQSNTQAGANMRFRLDPEIHISDNLRILSQIDLLDNLVLGSTSEGYSATAAGLGYSVNARDGYNPTGFDDQTTAAPRSGINSLSDSIHVKRVWAEYMSPVGALRFGRMPNHWGLGMVNHSGDGYDDDYQSTIDRIQFIAGIKPLDLYASAAWDFPNEGPTSSRINRTIPRPYDLGQLDDVDQYTFSVTRRKSPELLRMALTRGDIVVNAGLQLTYRKQLLAAEGASTCADGGASFQCQRGATSETEQPNYGNLSYTRRDAHYFLPDLWLQVLYKQFRFETEFATVQGSAANPDQATRSNTDQGPTNSGESRDLTRPRYKFRQWGLVGELEQKLLENKLRLGFGFGWASGDADVDGLSPAANGLPYGQLGGNRTVSTFRFNPAYRVDMILFRNILTRVQGVYYVRPNISYDFIRDNAGQRIGGTIAGIWSRASEFIQAPGHQRDLGIEVNGAIYYQSKDGSLNDDPSRMGGFYARLEYGILFPMAGLGYPNGTRSILSTNLERAGAGDISSAQTVRLYLGASF